ILISNLIKMIKLKIWKGTVQRIVLVFLSSLIWVSCDRFLDIEPKGVRILETVEDYDLWLNSDFLAASVPYELNLLTDHVDNVNLHNPPQNSTEWIYTWEEQF